MNGIPKTKNLEQTLRREAGAVDLYVPKSIQDSLQALAKAIEGELGRKGKREQHPHLDLYRWEKDCHYQKSGSGHLFLRFLNLLGSWIFVQDPSKKLLPRTIQGDFQPNNNVNGGIFSSSFNFLKEPTTDVCFFSQTFLS